MRSAVVTGTMSPASRQAETLRFLHMQCKHNMPVCILRVSLCEFT
jgi:hypothetical protein